MNAMMMLMMMMCSGICCAFSCEQTSCTASKSVVLLVSVVLSIPDHRRATCHYVNVLAVFNSDFAKRLQVVLLKLYCILCHFEKDYACMFLRKRLQFDVALYKPL